MTAHHLQVFSHYFPFFLEENIRDQLRNLKCISIHHTHTHRANIKGSKQHLSHVVLESFVRQIDWAVFAHDNYVFFFFFLIFYIQASFLTECLTLKTITDHSNILQRWCKMEEMLNFVPPYCPWGSQGTNPEVACHCLLQWTTFCQNSPPWPVRLGWPYMSQLRVSLSQTRLWSMWSDWLVFCDCGFHSVCPLMDKDKRLMEDSWWERLTVG